MIKVLIYLMIGVGIQLVGRIKMKLRGTEDEVVKGLAELGQIISKDETVDDSMKISEWSLFSVPGVLINTVLWPLNILIYLVGCVIAAFY